MTFNSLEFAVFFAVCLALYLPLPRRAQNRLLVVASYVFYAAWDWRFLGLLVLSTLVDWVLGRQENGFPQGRGHLVWRALLPAACLHASGHQQPRVIYLRLF